MWRDFVIGFQLLMLLLFMSNVGEQFSDGREVTLLKALALYATFFIAPAIVTYMAGYRHAQKVMQQRAVKPVEEVKDEHKDAA